MLPLQALPARQQVLQWLGQVQPQHLWALREHAHRSRARVWVASIAPAAGPGTVFWVPDFFNGLAPKDPCWQLCEHSNLRDPRANCLHFCSGGGARGSANNSVLCERKQSTPQRTLPNGQLWERNTQRLLCRWECSSPTYLTLQLRMDLRAAMLTTRRQILTPDTVVITTEQRELLSIQFSLSIQVTPAINHITISTR